MFSILYEWLSPDPYQQFASPYLAMANNSVSFVDPDGGFALSATLVEADFVSQSLSYLDQEKRLEEAAPNSEGEAVENPWLDWQNYHGSRDISFSAPFAGSLEAFSLMSGLNSLAVEMEGERRRNDILDGRKGIVGDGKGYILKNSKQEDSWDKGKLDTARDVDCLNDMEKDLIFEYNKVRSNPKRYAEENLEPLLQCKLWN